MHSLPPGIGLLADLALPGYGGAIENGRTTDSAIVIIGTAIAGPPFPMIICTAPLLAKWEENQGNPG